MRFDLCKEFMCHLDDGSLAVDHAPEEVAEWLEKSRLPMDLLRFLQWYWPQKSASLQHLLFWSSVSIMEDEQTERLMKHSLIPIGNAPNGDYLVLDFSKETCVPGFVSIHIDWDEKAAKKPRDSFAPLARTFESLLFRLVEQRYVPIDFPAARDFIEFLAEERANPFP
jgi:hypothetical protein